MNKIEYLNELKNKIQALPVSEQDEVIKYYTEYFDDAGLDNEDIVIKELGSPEELAKSILNNFVCVPIKRNTEKDNSKFEKEISTETNSNGTKILLLVILAIITFPIWGSIFGTIFGILFGIFITIIRLGAGLVIAAAAILLAGFFIFFFGFGLLFTSTLSGILTLGLGLFITGLGLLLMIVGAWVSGKIIPFIIRGVVNICQKIFWKKQKN